MSGYKNSIFSRTDDRHFLAQSHQRFVKAADGIRGVHLGSGVDGLVVVGNADPRRTGGKPGVLARVPLHRGAAVVAAALGDNVQRLGLGLVLLSQDLVVVEALDVAVLLGFFVKCGFVMPSSSP